MTTTHRVSEHTVTAELPRLTYDEPGARGERRHRGVPVVAAVLVLALFVALAAAAVHRRQLRSAAVDPPATLVVEDGHWRYVFHAPTGSEALYRTDVDPGCHTNLARDEPARTEGLRSRMLRQQGVDSVEALQEPHRGTVESLRGLGYL